MIQKLISRYRSLTSPVKMSLWFLLCSVLQRGIGMLTTPIFTRIMEETEYGRYSIYVTWFGFFSTLISMNLCSGFYLRSLVVNDRDRDRLTSSLMGLTLTMCVLAWTAFGLFSGPLCRLTGLNRFLLAMIPAETLLSHSFYFWMHRQRVYFNYRPIAVLTILTSVLTPLLSVLFVALAPAGAQVESRVTAVLLVDLCFYSAILFSAFRRGRTLYHREYWGQALAFSVPLIPHYLSKLVLNQADRIMIGSYCGLRQAGYYNVAYSLAAIFQIFNQAVASSLDPWLYRAIKERSFGALKQTTLKLLSVMAVLNLGVISVAPELLKFFAPDNFYSAVWVIPPVTASVFFMFMYDLFAAFQYYYSKTTWVMYASIAGALLNVVLNMIFIPRLGFLAAGYTTLVCYILFGMAHYFFMCRVCDEFLDGCRPYNIAGILGVGIFLLVGSGIMALLYPWPVIRYSLLLLMAAAAFFRRKNLLALFSELKKH